MGFVHVYVSKHMGASCDFYLFLFLILVLFLSVCFLERERQHGLGCVGMWEGPGGDEGKP